MTLWEWFWLAEDDDPHGGWAGGFGSREAAIADAQRSLSIGTRFYVMEARSSEARKHEGSECVPFLRTRNQELLPNHGVVPASGGAPPADVESSA